MSETTMTGARSNDPTSTGTAALVIEGLTKSYPAKRNLLGRVTETVDAVRGVSLEVRRGETLALVGESGAGKSTVGRLALRLIEPNSGSIRVLGDDITAMGRSELRKVRGRATMIFQDPFKSLNPRAQIKYSIAEPMLSQGGYSASDRDKRVAALLDRVGLAAHHLERYPYEMSGGQLQRVAIARALVTDPEIVVCDEPVAALDMSIRSHVINLLRELQSERNLAYLFISHDMSLVRVIADRIAVMKRGEIIECNDAATLFADPTHEYSRTLLSAIPAAHPSMRTFRPAPAARVAG
ncbi:oligopeptide transport system ATP-binding protein [Rhodococcus rhodochrous J3]|uniref:Peptide/nickel transport system ATP-binding protein/oligopeptide transport system ATP-binding protein n=3 Tax=Rhodococcus rhodochrous TaxID=1829 RepID=A0A562E8C6_RHORH|nr:MULTISPECIES: ATP-binding cassette domain-containing protein [Rhodococcus]MCD2099906.1 ATP-binding cassette domain-containing protein [Rhodococcus rhodochrous]MCD2124320.1 ATP-binding cassette domain-containing protein [Rhodococcus rhodochrous]MCK8672072.1 ATP-binding cassette domain-containing protein [Rhodococcus sp. HM1]MCQ4135887.1 ATP-binding cassette domain-containing protein [Rhodococcus rhodochrous]MDJ0021038.1 ATP-binding cassette domain-containing protein [Rhodococcus rhodochrous]